MLTKNWASRVTFLCRDERLSRATARDTSDALTSPGPRMGRLKFEHACEHCPWSGSYGREMSMRALSEDLRLIEPL